jgi:hypothetical protein
LDHPKKELNIVEPIAHVRFTDGVSRPVFEDAQGQWVFDEDGNKIQGDWFIPRDECDVPAVVDAIPHSDRVFAT